MESEVLSNRQFHQEMNELIDNGGRGVSLESSRVKLLDILAASKQRYALYSDETHDKQEKAIALMEEFIERELENRTDLRFDKQIEINNESYHILGFSNADGYNDRIYRLAPGWKLEGTLSGTLITPTPVYDKINPLIRGQLCSNVDSDPYGLCLLLTDIMFYDPNNDPHTISENYDALIPVSYPNLALHQAIPHEIPVDLLA